MTPDDLIRRVDEKASLDFLARMVRHRSYSQSEGERKLAEFMAESMRAIGLDAELQPVDEGERVNAIGRWRGTGGGRSLMFNGHVDTNPVTEGWTVDPVGGEPLPDRLRQSRREHAAPVDQHTLDHGPSQQNSVLAS